MKHLAWSVVVAAILAGGPVARAEEPEHAAATHEAAPGGAHEAGEAAAEGHQKGGGGHWSVAELLVPESVREAARADLGDSFIEGQPVATVDHVAFAILVVAILLALVLFASYSMKAAKDPLLPAPRLSPLGVFQVLANALLALMTDIMGRERALKFLPLVGSLGFFILCSNLLGLIPGFLPPTSNLNTTFALGTVVFLATHYYGVQAHGISYFKHFFGPILKWYALPLMVLMFVIEMISHVARPVSLGIRLFGNMFGDHSTVAGFLGVGVIGWVMLPIIPFPLGILVCVVQTLVFCILSTVYLHVATEEDEEAHHAEAAAH